MNNELMVDFVTAVIESADEVKEKPVNDLQDYGQLLAYAEVLSILRDLCTPEELQRFGLDFDIDKRYL